ncbi:MAG: T9SS type A sorting domain-containing protein [Saprospiraceae bacterium]|nr:T9SS type A sorting domain-containing protein [Saprospiraceae bacterium]
MLNLHKTDSIEGQSWDASTQSWGPTNGKLYYTYDCEREKVLGYTTVSSDGTNFINSYKTAFSYHPTGEIKTIKDYNFVLDDWSQNAEYEYRPSGEYASYWLYTQISNGIPQSGNKYVYSYDGAENLLSEEWFEYNTSIPGWLPSLKKTNTYDSEQKITSSLVEVFTSGTWFQTSQTLYSYDGDDRLMVALTQEFFGTVWQNKLRLVYNYATGSQPSTIVREAFIASQWLPSKRYTHSYDANENLTQHITELYVNNSAWQQDSLRTHTYHADNSKAGNHYAVWNNINGNWVETSFDSTDAGGDQVVFISRYGYNANNNSFQGGIRFVNTWYANQLESSLRDYLEAGTFDTWTPSQKDFYTFDANDLQLQGTVQFWNPSINDFENARQDNHFNSTCLVGNTDVPATSSQALTCRMANPYLPGQSVQCDGMLAPGTQPSVELYDMAGRLAHRQALSSNTFDLPGDTTPGMYMLLVKSSGSVHFRSKIVVQHP